MIDEVIDFISDIFGYIFSFEWIGDIWDFVGSMFENITEISIYVLFLVLLVLEQCSSQKTICCNHF